MLNMVGGKDALGPIKDPVKKIKEIFDELSLQLNKDSINFSAELQKNIEFIVDKRLELTSEHVKIIMKEMIQNILGGW